MLKNLAVVLIATALTLVAGDWLVGWLPLDPVHAAAAKQGRGFDRRTRLDVILDLRKAGEDVWPTVPPNLFLGHPLQVDGHDVLPLSGLQLVKVIGCNESGTYSSFRTDGRGFRNPPGTWDDGRIDVALVGDSFTQGDCVEDGDTIADHVRAIIPGTVNLGSGGNGPLLTLATLVEHLGTGPVGTVFWLYYEGNDLKELLRERENSQLSRYLQAGVSQGLLELGPDVDAAMRKYVERQLRERVGSRPSVLPNLRALLWRLRNRRAARPDASEIDPRSALETMRLVLARARREVEMRGGRLVFVYLPEYARFKGEIPLSHWARQKKEVLLLAREAGIQTIDVEPTLRSEDDARSLYPFGLPGHFNARGYKLVAGPLVEYLRNSAE